MVFIETAAFTKTIYKYLSEDEYLGLQGFFSSIQNRAKLFQARVVSEKSAGRSLEKGKAVAFG
jgi:hypothetical protein